MLPMISDPRTMSTGAPGPTAAARDPSVTLTQDRPATRMVTRPRQSVTTERVRSGSRCPMAMPTRAPMTTATTLMSVPSPGNPARTRATLRAEPAVPARAPDPGLISAQNVLILSAMAAWPDRATTGGGQILDVPFHGGALTPRVDQSVTRHLVAWRGN